MIKRETKELGTETRPREGVMKEEKFPTPGNALTSGSMGSFGISEGNITGKGKKKKTQNTCLNHNSQWRRSPDARDRQQRAGAEQGGVGCIA